MTDRSQILPGARQPVRHDLVRPACAEQGEPELVVTKDPDAAAGEAAERIAAALVAAIHGAPGDFCTTGAHAIRLPAAIQAPLVDTSRAARPCLVGDDRFVPRGHPESNVTPWTTFYWAAADRSAELSAVGEHPPFR